MKHPFRQFLRMTSLEVLAVLLGAGISEYVKTLLGSPSWVVFLFILVPVLTLVVYAAVPGFVTRHIGLSKKLAVSVHWIVGVQAGLAGGALFSGIIVGTTSFLLVPVFGVGLFLGVSLVNLKIQAWTADETPEKDSMSTSKLPTSEGWFREADLNLFSKRRLFLMTLVGVLVGGVASALIMLYAGLLYRPLITGFWSGVEVGIVLVAGLGLYRNRVLKRVAAKGLPAVFRFRRVDFIFYIYAVLTGALGLGYGYGYFSAQSTILVLPFAALFFIFLYLYYLWKEILVKSEEGRLCIFQFIVEHGEDGNGYSWLKHGLSMTRGALESFGVSAKRNNLYFGSSYSLLEGSYVEWDLDYIYFLGDWTSQPNEKRPVHEIASWFLHRSKRAERRGFSRVFSLTDHLYEISPQNSYYIIGAIGVIVGIVTAIIRR